MPIPKGKFLHKNMSYDVQIIKFGPLFFAQLSLLSIGHTPPKVSLHVAASTFPRKHVPGPT